MWWGKLFKKEIRGNLAVKQNATGNIIYFLFTVSYIYFFFYKKEGMGSMCLCNGKISL